MPILTKLTTLILPLPPTDNRLRQPVIMNRHPQLVPTTEYTSWKKQAAKAIARWRVQNPEFKQYKPSLKQFLFFEYRLFMGSRRTDPNNFGKAIQDALTSDKDCDNRFLSNDRYVAVQLAKELPQVDPQNPRVEINPFPVCCVK